MEAVLVGVGLLHAAGHVQNQVEQLGAHVGDGLLAGGDGAGVDVDESNQCSFISLREQTLMTGAAASP